MEYSLIIEVRNIRALSGRRRCTIYSDRLAPFVRSACSIHDGIFILQKNSCLSFLLLKIIERIVMKKFGRVMKNILLAIIVIVSIIAVIFVKFILPILLLVAGFWIGLIGGLLKDK